MKVETVCGKDFIDVQNRINKILSASKSEDVINIKYSVDGGNHYAMIIFI